MNSLNDLKNFHYQTPDYNLIKDSPIMTEKRRQRYLSITACFNSYHLDSSINQTELLGQGFNGEVYKANMLQPDLKSPLEVACKKMKIVKSKPVEDEEIDKQRKKFMKESILHCSIIPHPNIVRAIGTYQETLIMEYGVKACLDKNIPSYYLHAIKGLARGLNHLHSQGVIHNDVARRNIVFDKDNNPKIIDFGLARQLKKDNEGNFISKKLKGCYLPTKWAAPETLMQQITSIKSDVWMFGITCLELISQEEPMPAIANEVYFYQVCIYNFILLTRWKEEMFDKNKVCQELQEMITSCFETNPDKRPDMKLLLQTLKNIN